MICSALCFAAKVKQYIKDSVSSQNSTFTLFHLASLEKKVAKNFQVKDFLSLEQGNFLEFLVKHIQVYVCMFYCFFRVGIIMMPLGNPNSLWENKFLVTVFWFHYLNHDLFTASVFLCAAAAGLAGLCSHSGWWHHGTCRKWFQTHKTRCV